MNNLHKKISLTIVCAIIMASILVLMTMFGIAVWEMNDDAMFTYGIVLAALGGSVSLLAFSVMLLDSIWENKQNKKKDNDCE